MKYVCKKKKEKKMEWNALSENIEIYLKLNGQWYVLQWKINPTKAIRTLWEKRKTRIHSKIMLWFLINWLQCRKKQWWFSLKSKYVVSTYLWCPSPSYMCVLCRMKASHIRRDSSCMDRSPRNATNSSTVLYRSIFRPSFHHLTVMNSMCKYSLVVMFNLIVSPFKTSMKIKIALFSFQREIHTVTVRAVSGDRKD